VVVIFILMEESFQLVAIFANELKCFKIF